MTPALFRSVRGYDRGRLRGDAVAGLTVWAVLVPEALAYATIAGVPPVVGLYAAPGALILYAAFGSSRHLVTGPMSATAALSAGAVAELATQGSTDYASLSVALAIATGAAGVLAGLLRMGFVANFISEPVLKGFIVGLALTIIVGQLPKVLGIEKGSGDFFEKLWDLVTNLGDTSGTTLAVGAVSFAIVIGLRRLLPAVPGSLVAVAFGVGAVKLLDLSSNGVDIVGHIQGGLPPFGLPEASGRDYLDLGASGVGILLVGFAEGLGAAKTYAAVNHYDVDPNAELLGLGAANLASGLSSGMVVNGSLSKTAVNGGTGANTQLSGLIVAALTVVTLIFLTGLFESLPEATLGAVVVAAVIELVDVPALRRLYRVVTLTPRLGVAARPDFVAAIAALAGVLVFDTLPGLAIGIVSSIVLLIYRASRPNVVELGHPPGRPGDWADRSRHPDHRPERGVVVLRVEAGLFFANADHVRAAVRSAAAADDVHAVVLDAGAIAFIDVTAAEMLATLHADLHREHVALLVAHDTGQVRDTLSETGTAEVLGDRHVFPTIADAVEAARTGPPG